MKILTILFVAWLMLAMTIVDTSTSYCKGWKKGYVSGWCRHQPAGFCMKPFVPQCPWPEFGKDTYEWGKEDGSRAGEYAYLNR